MRASTNKIRVPTSLNTMRWEDECFKLSSSRFIHCRQRPGVSRAKGLPTDQDDDHAKHLSLEARVFGVGCTPRCISPIRSMMIVLTSVKLLHIWKAAQRLASAAATDPNANRQKGRPTHAAGHVGCPPCWAGFISSHILRRHLTYTHSLSDSVNPTFSRYPANASATSREKRA